MSEYFTSGRAIDVVLLFVVVEAAVLAKAKARLQLSALDIVGQLGAGVCLLLAVRAALTGAGWPLVALFVTLSLPLHLFDLVRRTRAS